MLFGEDRSDESDYGFAVREDLDHVGGRTVSVDVGAANRQLVLENDVIFGSVNANRSHYEAAAAALTAADARWLAGISPVGSRSTRGSTRCNASPTTSR
ncbi:MAG: hypothetical protein WKF58_18040 [Ilumatobacteraceae bacterium]